MFKSARMRLVCLVTLISSSPAFAEQKQKQDSNNDVIYGADDRLDVYQVQNPVTLKLVDATVGIFPKADLVQDPSNADNLKYVGETFAQSYQLCANEPFREQPSAAVCSGTLVGPDLILTAGHCIDSQQECNDSVFAFGYHMKSENDSARVVAKKDVYRCSSIVARKQEFDGEDWAVIRLDRMVTDHTPLSVQHDSKLSQNDPVFVIGHPAGLPTKVAGGAKVRAFENNKAYFVANLDTYGGNSGSAVFNANTGLIEGILVRGETDFVYNRRQQCRESNKCSDNSCRGEDVTKISAVLKMVALPISNPH